MFNRLAHKNTDRLRSSQARYLLRIFGIPFLAWLFSVGFVVAFNHLRAGTRSPGLAAILAKSMQFSTPILFAIVFALPSFIYFCLLLIVRKRARLLNMTWYAYMDLPFEERRRLMDAHKNEKGIGN